MNGDVVIILMNFLSKMRQSFFDRRFEAQFPPIDQTTDQCRGHRFCTRAYVDQIVWSHQFIGFQFPDTGGTNANRLAVFLVPGNDRRNWYVETHWVFRTIKFCFFISRFNRLVDHLLQTLLNFRIVRNRALLRLRFLNRKNTNHAS